MTSSKSFLLATSIIILTFSTSTVFAQQATNSTAFNKLLNDYYEEGLLLNPIAATQRGDNRYNDLLPNNISFPYLKSTHDYNVKFRRLLATYERNSLNSSDKISFDIVNDQTQQAMGRERFHLEFKPFNQGAGSLPTALPSMGSGLGIQPFKTAQDYNNWLKRIDAFSGWADTAIANFNKGIASGMVLPKALVLKMIPQLEAQTIADTSKNIFYAPIRNMPTSFLETEKTSIRLAYQDALTSKIIPTYKKLADYLKNIYLDKARSTSGYNALPNGPAIYRFLVQYYTTGSKSPEKIYETGLKEVTRITKEIDVIKNKVGFSGSTGSLFTFLKTDKQFFPFTTEEQVLDSFRAILPRMEPNLKKLFNIVPKAAFEVRAIEKFKAASSASNYQTGTEDGSRPGYFNARILDAVTLNTPGMESLFAHEAIPGHHFQLSLQQENIALPKVRRYAGYNAFIEGWGLYAESLGDELGLYTNAYEKIAALSSELFRAARLVVDVALHTGKMTREEAITYMVEKAGLDERIATSEVERYMANPGQALSYKTGELKIKELRTKYEKSLGTKFNIKSFHDAILLGGSMPLSVFKSYMDDWAQKQ
jgi:uncharacterized protein (DUF885 family)